MKTRLVVGLALAGGLVACSGAPRTEHDGAVTSGDQSHAKTDLSITQSVRRAVVADTGLSTNARDVKIVTSNGVVTLRGPVANASERLAVGATAQRVAGVSRVENELEIADQ